MCRKFLQMGMTRAKRYANFKGGRKYDYVKKEEGSGEEGEGKEKGERVQREKGEEHEGKKEKEEASLVFRGWWDKARMHEGYKELKEEWQREKKAWEKDDGAMKGEQMKAEDVSVKKEEIDEPVKKKGKSKVKVENVGEDEQPPKKRTRIKRENS